MNHGISGGFGRNQEFRRGVMGVYYGGNGHLRVRAIADGQYLLRSGNTIVGGPGGGGGSGEGVNVTVDFGATFTDKAQAVVTGEAWVAAGSSLTANVVCPVGTDPDEMYLLNFRTVISDKVVGDGFTITVYTEAEAKGTYTVNCVGV